ncbi:hypothetical protein [Slackia piriformis]|uniref:hypothetical protein n=1 Tax=Slackia piriformis TaxID=626934 RepID=UPI0039F62A90
MNQQPGRHLPFFLAGSLYADAPRAVVVTVVDAFLTVAANQASSTEQKGVVSSEMLRNKSREPDETIS